MFTVTRPTLSKKKKENDCKPFFQIFQKVFTKQNKTDNRAPTVRKVQYFYKLSVILAFLSLYKHKIYADET